MALSNTAYDIIGGFEVTQTQTTNTNDTVAVSTGVYRTRTVGTSASSGTTAWNAYADSAYTSVLGASIAAIISYAATGYKRIDLVVLDTSAITTATPFKIVSGTPVLASGTAAVPSVASATQIPLATIAVSDSTVATIAKRVDVRDTADFLPVRAFNRSQAVRIGKQVVRSGANVYVDLNDPVSAKELSYHSSIGAVYHTGALTNSPGDLQVNTGLVTTKSGTTGSGTYTLTDGEIRNADNQVFYTIAPVTKTATTIAALPSSGQLRNDLVYVDVFDPSAPVYGVVPGTAATSAYTAAGVKYTSLTKDQIPLAVVVAAPTNWSNAKVVDVRTNR